MKVIPLSPGRNAEDSMNEFTLMKNLNHPNILKPYECFQAVYKEVQSIVIILEYCEEGDLQYYISK
jgi:serine/threonine protein kinase